MQALKTGDLLFQVDGNTPLTEAISTVTNGFCDVSYNHVGIVCVNQGQLFVLEAIASGVMMTVLENFLKRSSQYMGEPLVMAARIKKFSQKQCTQAVNRAKKLIGKPYDFTYLPDNDRYYCSELVSCSFLEADGSRVFEPKPMHFSDESGKILDFWVKHYKQFHLEVPVGVLGTNPGSLSQSKRLEILHFYFNQEEKK